MAENMEIKDMKPATVPKPGKEITRMAVEGELSSGDGYMAQFIHVEAKADERDGAGKNKAVDGEVEERLRKSGL